MSELLQVFQPNAILALDGRLAATVKAQRGRLSPEHLEAIAGGSVEIRAAAAIGTAKARRPQVGVVGLFGLLLNGYGAGKFATDVSAARAQVKQLAADPGISAILLAVDSPGGEVGGIEELASAVMAARTAKPVVAGVVGVAASAAYWVAAAADQIIVTPSGVAGSIGVYATHVDISGALAQAGEKVTLIASSPEKVQGNPFEPLTPGGRAQIQKDVLTIYGVFVKQVAQGRGVTPSVVQARYGQGRALLAREALSAGLVDRLGSFEDAVDVAAGAAAWETTRTQTAQQFDIPLPPRWSRPDTAPDTAARKHALLELETL